MNVYSYFMQINSTPYPKYLYYKHTQTWYVQRAKGSTVSFLSMSLQPQLTCRVYIRQIKRTVSTTSRKQAGCLYFAVSELTELT